MSLIWTFLPLFVVCIGTAQTLEGTESHCQAGFFPCKNSNTCIEQRLNCDNKTDCEDGSDERDCNDRKYDILIDSMFQKRPIALQDDLNQTCLLVYNGTCTCKRHSLVCSGKNYTKAPEDLPNTEIEILDFTGNFFTTLAPATLKTVPSEVAILVLKHCHIERINNLTFYNLGKLEELFLDNNFLRVFPSHIFPPGSKLVKLVLSYNKVQHIENGAFDNLRDLEELELNNNNLLELRRILLEPLTNLSKLMIKGNQIKLLDSNMFPEIPLQTLSLSENNIEELPSRSFSSLSELTHLILSGNRIKEMKNGTFENLEKLTALDLDNNQIFHIETGVFHPTLNLETLLLRGNPIRTLHKNVLLPLANLKHVYFEEFKTCIAAPKVHNCNPKGDGISSQWHLLDNPLLRTSVWIMGVIGCVGNIIVFLGRMLTTTTNPVHSLYIRNLALSDFLMGVYLLTIATVDNEYRGVYIYHEDEWTNSHCCNFCGFLSTLSCLSSALILALVTYDRLISITQPLARRQPSSRTAGLTLLCLWIISLTASLAPINIAKDYFREFYGNNGVCLPLYIHNPRATGWEYSAALFILVNAASLIFICYAYVRMIREIRASGVACRSTQQSQERDKVAQRLGIIVLTDCLCWVPVIIVKLAALSGQKIPESLYAWLAILILPINSALNPVLYTLTTTVFKKQIEKIYNSCIEKRRRTEPTNSNCESSLSFSLGMLTKGPSTRRTLTYRGTQSSLASSKNSWKSSTAV